MVYKADRIELESRTTFTPRARFVHYSMVEMRDEIVAQASLKNAKRPGRSNSRAHGGIYFNYCLFSARRDDSRSTQMNVI